MANCQECNSEVADQDTFCPYCGISLQPVVVSGDDSVDMGNTIVMQAPVPKIISDIVAPPPDETSDVPDETSTTADETSTTVVESSDAADEPFDAVDEPFDSADEPSDAADETLDVADEVENAGTADNVPELMEHEEAVESDDMSEPEEFADLAPDPPEVVSTPLENISEDVPLPNEEPEAVDSPQVVDSTEPEAFVIEDASVELSVGAYDPDEVSPEEQTVPEIDANDAEAKVVERVDAEVADSGDASISSVTEPVELIEPVEDEHKYPFSLVESDVVIDTDVVMLSEQDIEPEPTEIESASESPELESKVEAPPETATDAVPVAAFTDPAAIKAGTSSGDLGADSKLSFTTPNLEAGTDGKRSGLKPLSEGILLNGRYKIVKKIGGGGMGAVYLAVDQNLGGTQRAVKEMVQSHIEEEQQAKAIEDFKRESMILSALDHPSIPTIYDYFFDEAESRFYLVMKYISGGDLAGRLRSAPEGRIDERTVTEWAVQVIDVLHYLHSLPTTIVYRDLKPSNIMIDGNTGRVMLIDFGIARSINQTQEKGVTAVGTMGYAPPELFSGQVEPRSDIYSLGSTMFHLLTGADPQNNPLLIFDFQKNPRPRQINPRLSDQMERILMRAVEYSADARFSSALEMKLALQQHLEDLGAGRVSYGISEAPAAVSLANQNVFCGFCGQRIVATDLFCAFCGSKQPLAQHGVHSEIYAARANATARLVIEGTSQLEMPAYMLDKSENLVGRRDPTSNIFPEVDLSKFDPQTKISRRHARVWRDGSSFLVEDLGSSNGTILLGSAGDALRLTPHQAHPLANGDRIRVGDTTLHFILG